MPDEVAWAQPSSESGRRRKYSLEQIERVLRLRVSSGMLWNELSVALGISSVTMQYWAKMEKQRGTELGKLLCSGANQRARAKADRANPKTVVFPGGSEYRAGENGGLVLIGTGEAPAKEPEVAAYAAPVPAPTQKVEASEEVLVNEIIEELALKIGRQTVEIVSLKARLRHCQKA